MSSFSSCPTTPFRPSIFELLPVLEIRAPAYGDEEARVRTPVNNKNNNNNKVPDIMEILDEAISIVESCSVFLTDSTIGTRETRGVVCDSNDNENHQEDDKKNSSSSVATPP